MSFDFVSLLGRSVRDPALRRLLEYVEEAPQATQREPDLENRYYLEFPGTGFSLLINAGGVVETVHFHTTDQAYKQPFPFELPLGLIASMSQKDSRLHLGKPAKSGGPTQLVGCTPAVYWDLWDFDRHSLHLEYPLERDSLSLVTLQLFSLWTNEHQGV